MDRYLPLITGSGGALVILALVAWAFYSGKIHSASEFGKLEQENEQLRDAYDKLLESVATERKTVNETAAAGTITNQLISVIANMAAGRREQKPGLTPEDLGL